MEHTIDLVSLLKISMATAPSKKWPTFDGGTLSRHEFITASEAYYCVRKLAFDKNHEAQMAAAGTKTQNSKDFFDNMSDEDFVNFVSKATEGGSPLGIFERGNTIEDWIVKKLKAVEQPDIEKFALLGEEQVSFYIAKHKLSCTPDCVYIDLLTNAATLLEFKSSNSPVTRPRPAHVTQVLINMGIIRRLIADGSMKMYMPELDECELQFGKLLYVLADDYLQMQQFEIQWDGGETYNKALAKAVALFKGGLKQPHEVVAEGLQSSFGCSFCKHKSACLRIEQEAKDAKNVETLQRVLRQDSGEEVPRMPTFRADEKDRVLSALFEYDRFNKAEKEAEAQKKALRDAITEWVKQQPNMKASFVDRGHKVSVSLSQSTRAGGWDADKLVAVLEEIGKDVSEFVKPGTDVETLRVTVK